MWNMAYGGNRFVMHMVIHDDRTHATSDANCFMNSIFSGLVSLVGVIMYLAPFIIDEPEFS